MEQPALALKCVKCADIPLRNACVLFIFQCGTRLKVPQPTIATAVVFFYKFFGDHSLAEHDGYEIARSCLFLACKSEETPRRFRDIINTGHLTQSPGDSPLALDQVRVPPKRLRFSRR